MRQTTTRTRDADGRRMATIAARACAAAGLAALVAGSAPAQAQQSTSATYDDWVLACQNQPAPATKKLCAVSQIARMKENNQPFSRVLIDKPTAGKPAVLVVQLPDNATVTAPVTVKVDAADAGLSAPFRRCLPAGCFADFELGEDALKRFRAAGGDGKIVFEDASGREISAPLSMKGFRAAFDALLKD